MSKALVTVNPNLPAVFRSLPVSEITGELTGGVTSGFPILSYKGKVWRIRKGGDEELHLDKDGNAAPTVDLVLVQANPSPSKIFYDKQYEEGANETPRCFSNDGSKPDISVQAPISAICANCPNNVWGSRMTPSGKKSRACSDSRRVAVVFAQDLLDNGKDAMLLLLRVPPASLNPMKDYAEKVLAPKGIPFFAVATQIAFEPTAAHPQFKFKPARLLNDDEAEAILALRGSPDVERILAETQEFPAGAAGSEASAASTGNTTGNGAGGQATPSASPNPAPAAKQKMRPASEEEAGADVLDQPPPAATPKAKPAASKPAAAKPAAAVEEDPLAGLNAPPPASPKKKPPAGKPAAAAPAQEPDEEEEAAPATPQRAAATAGAAPPADFDNLLDSILNG